MATIVGVDIGQSVDWTAIIIIDQVNTGFHARFIERPPRGTPYPVVIRGVNTIMERKGREFAELVVDATGVGRPIVEQMWESGLSPVPVVITAGHNEIHDGWSYRVPKRNLVSSSQYILQNGMLSIPKGHKLATTMVSELRNFKVKIDPKTAHDSYAAGRESEHDDLVLALCLALWRAQKYYQVPKKELKVGSWLDEREKKLLIELEHNSGLSEGDRLMQEAEEWAFQR